MMLDQTACLGQPRGIGRQRLQLQQQAFGRAAGADALRIESLNPPQDFLGFGRRHRDFIGQTLANLLQRQGQITGFADRVDDGGGDRQFPLVERRQPHLPVQMVAQRFPGAGIALVGVPFLVLAAGIVGRAVIRFVDILPGAVHRQFVRQGTGRRVDFGLGAVRRLSGGGFRPHRQILRLVGLLQHQVGVENRLHLHLQVQAGQLQQANRLLQLGSHGQLLTQA